jgi:hypothetical protein
MAQYIQQIDWNWYVNDAVDPTNIYGGGSEDNAPTMVSNTDIVRFRCSLGLSSGIYSASLSMGYSKDGITFTQIGPTEEWDYAVGLGPKGDPIGTLLISSSTLQGHFHIDASDNDTFTSANRIEIDFALQPTATIVPDTRYYFKINNAAVLAGKTLPQIITKDAPSSSKSPLYSVYLVSLNANYVQTSPNPLFRLSSKRIFHYGESVNAIDRLN